MERDELERLIALLQQDNDQPRRDKTIEVLEDMYSNCHSIDIELRKTLLQH